MIKSPKLYLSQLGCFWRSNRPYRYWSICENRLMEIFDIPMTGYKIQFTAHLDPGEGRIELNFLDDEVRVVATGKSYLLIPRTSDAIHQLIGATARWYVECHYWPKPTLKDYLTLGLFYDKRRVKV